MPVRGVMQTVYHSDIKENLNVWLICEPIDLQQDLFVWRGTGDAALCLLSAEYPPKHMEELPLLYFQFFLYGCFFASY
jgi:hypothetical protein